MSLNFIAEIWDALKSHVDFNERKDAADTLVNFLIDNNYEAEDIKDSFSGEKEILTALKDYISEHDLVDDFDEEDNDEDEDW